MKKTWLGLLIAITLLGAILRLYCLARYSLWYDEATSIFGSYFVDWSLGFLRRETGVTPFIAFLVRFWYPLIMSIPGVAKGSTLFDFFLRLMPCLFGIACIPLTFLLARYLLKDTCAALFAALLLAVSPFHVYYAQELRPPTLYVAVAVVTIFFTLKALEEDRARHWIAMTACMALSMYAYYFALWILFAINLFFLLTIASNKQHLGKWIVSQGVMAVLIIPPLYSGVIEAKIHERAKEHWFPHPTLVTAGITIKNFFAGYGPHQLVYWPLFLFGGGLMALGIYALRTKPKPLLFLLLLAFVPILGNIIVWNTRDFAFYTYRAQIVSSIPCFILAAVGLLSLKKKPLIVIAAGLFAALTAPALADHYAQRLHPIWHHRLGVRYKPDNRSAARYIAARMKPGDFVGHVSHYTLAPFKEHYLEADQADLGFTNEEREGMLASYPDEELWEKTGWLPVRIEEAIAGAKRVWFVESWWEPDELPPLARELRRWLDAQAVRIDHVRFDRIAVYLYSLDPQLRASVVENQVADYGAGVLHHYVFAEGEFDSDLQEEWESYFARQFPLPGLQATSGYAVSFDVKVLDNQDAPHGTPTDVIPGYSILVTSEKQDSMILAAVPSRADGAHPYRIRVVNAAGAPRTIQGRVYESTSVIGALSFTRERDSEVWRPTHQYNLNAPPRYFNKSAMSARLSREDLQGTLRRDVVLERGRYAVFIRFLEQSAPVNEWRGLLRFTATYADGITQAIGSVHGHNPSGVNGWTWRRVGDMNADGKPVTLTLTAENVDGLPRSYFDLDRVMFVPVEAAQGDSPVTAERFEVTLEPFGEELLTFSSTPDGVARRRVDIEFFDEESKEFRSLYFHVDRGDAG